MIKTYRCMLPNVYRKFAQKVDWGTAFSQPALDGVRVFVTAYPDGKTGATGHEYPVAGLSFVLKLVSKMRIHVADHDVVGLDMLARLPGADKKTLAAACRSRNKDTKNVQFVLYDAMIGKADFKTRYAFAQDFVSAAGEPFSLAETVKVRSDHEFMQTQAHFIEKGSTGAVVRYGAGPYEAGKTSPRFLADASFARAAYPIVDAKTDGKRPVFTCQTPTGVVFDVQAPLTMSPDATLKMFIGCKLRVRFCGLTKASGMVPQLPVAVGFGEYE